MVADRTRNRPWWWIPLLSFVLVACPQRTAIWIVPGASVEHLVFGVSDEVGGTNAVDFTFLRVYRCERQALDTAGTVWMVEPAHNRPPYPTKIVYGETPTGYQTTTGPFPLKVGCYDARIVGTGMVRFIVREDGSIVEAQASSPNRR